MGQLLTCGISLAQRARSGRISPDAAGGKRTVMSGDAEIAIALQHLDILGGAAQCY